MSIFIILLFTIVTSGVADQDSLVGSSLSSGAPSSANSHGMFDILMAQYFEIKFVAIVGIILRTLRTRFNAGTKKCEFCD